VRDACHWIGPIDLLVSIWMLANILIQYLALSCVSFLDEHLKQFQVRIRGLLQVTIAQHFLEMGDITLLSQLTIITIVVTIDA
jgi:hypothetical protein